MILVVGIIILVGGILLRYMINRRKFYRRNMIGLESFSSYEKSWIIPFFEWIGKLISLALILLGFFLIWGHYDSKEKVKKAKSIQNESLNKPE